ncbi:MAG: class I SAM-dependent methyltransferase [Acidimicrobiales bacterium]
MAGLGANEYGDAHADVYERIYGARFTPDAAVDALSRAAGQGGRLLELGLGTGRLAIPLLECGVHVDGIEASAAMIARLRAQPGGDRVGVFQVDLAGFTLPSGAYDVAVCAVSTLFMLPGRAAQQRCIAAAAQHLRPGGRLFIEAFRPDASRFDASGKRVESRPDPAGSGHLVRSHHDAQRRCIQISHELTDTNGTSTAYEVTLHYLTPDEIDVLASCAGLRLVARWHDWSTQPAVESTPDPISVYELDSIR